MKKFNIAWTLPCFLLAGNASANIIISEVVEGSSYNKAIEIANVAIKPSHLMVISYKKKPILVENGVVITN